MKNKIIIDLEFNGLYRYNFVPEITQVKMKNLTNGLSICKNFKTYKKGVGRPFYGEIKGDVYFSNKEFEKLLNKIGGTLKDIFYGFSIKTDKRLLASYEIYLGEYQDIQEHLMLKKKYEKEMAYGGRSLEYCYFMITGVVTTVDHNSIKELELIQKCYEATRGKKMEYLTIFPWGDDAGTPLEEYCSNNRRRADGYRFNNDDILSSSLDYYCEDIW
jgi:hypothetical protein